MAYLYRRAVVIDHTKVPNSNLTNFPMLFAGTYSYLADEANGGKVKTANGYDIIFTSDPEGSTILNFQRLAWINTTGQVVFWISIPTLSTSVDTVIYLHYGKASDTDHANVATVWTGANYVAVHHLNEANEATMVDSTGNDGISPATHYPRTTAGKIYKGMQFLSSDTRQAGGVDNDCPSGSAARTMSIWFNTTYAADKDLCGYGTIGTSMRGFYMRAGVSPVIYMDLGAGGGTVEYTWVNNNTDWHLWHACCPAGAKTNDVLFYFDGALKTVSRNGGTNTLNTLLTAKQLGHRPGGTGAYFWTGDMEEFRISSDQKSADWIATEFNNQNSPSTFYSVGEAGGILLNPDLKGGMKDLYGGF